MRTEQEISRIIDLHGNTVLRVCVAGAPSKADGEDIFQQTFLKFANSKTEFESDEHVKAWLIRVAVNMCKDLYRSSHYKDATLDSEEFEGDTILGACVDQYPSDQDQRLKKALLGLKEDQRQALVLIYVEGYDTKEVAEMLDKPLNTIYTLVARGKKKLKEVLEHEGIQ